MQRGIISFTQSELKAISKKIVWDKIENTPLENKVLSGLKGSETPSDIEILLSQNEAEIILDDLGIPSENDSEELLSARKKLSLFLVEIR